MDMMDRVARALHKAHYTRGRKLPLDWPTDRFEQEMWRMSARTAIETVIEALSDDGHASAASAVRECSHA